MQKVKMLKEVLGSRDGIKVEKFVEGSEYEVSDSLLNDFISMGAVELVEVKEAKEEPVKPAKGKK